MVRTERRIYHPIQRDAVTFLETAEETNGEYLLIEVELAPHGPKVAKVEISAK